MVDLSQYTSLAGLTLLLGVVVQVLKAALPLGESHKRFLPGLTVLLGIALALILGYTVGQIRGGQDVLSWIVGGFLAGAAEIGVYESIVKPGKRVVGSGSPGVSVDVT